MGKKKISLFFILSMLLVFFSSITVMAASDFRFSLEPTTTAVSYVKAGTTRNYVAKKDGKVVSASKLKWTSSDTSIASVNSKGVLAAKKNGVVTIEVSLKSDSRVYRKINIYVYKKSVKRSFTNVSESTIVLNKGNSKTLKPSVKARFRTVYKSSDSSIVSVDQNGKITAKKNGTATITYITVGTYYNVAKVNVIVGKKVTKIATGETNDTLRMIKGKTYQVNPVVSPTTATIQKVSYSIADTSVAKVSSKGVITAKKVGTTVLTIKATDGTGKYTRLRVVVQSSSRASLGTSQIIAHRGLRSQAPENTLPAFELAGQYGFDAAECDVRVTKDGELVLMHDESLLRMCGIDVKVSELTLAELKKYPIISGSNASKYKNNYIPTLDEYIACCNQYMMTPIIELKDKTMTTTALEKLYASISKSYKAPAVISFYRAGLKWLRNKDASLELYNVAWEATDDELTFCKKYNTGMSVDYRKLTTARMNKILKQGIKLAVWTVNDKSTLTYYKNAGVTYVTTEYFYS